MAQWKENEQVMSDGSWGSTLGHIFFMLHSTRTSSFRFGNFPFRFSWVFGPNCLRSNWFIEFSLGQYLTRVDNRLNSRHWLLISLQTLDRFSLLSPSDSPPPRQLRFESNSISTTLIHHADGEHVKHVIWDYSLNWMTYIDLFTHKYKCIYLFTNACIYIYMNDIFKMPWQIWQWWVWPGALFLSFLFASFPSSFLKHKRIPERREEIYHSTSQNRKPQKGGRGKKMKKQTKQNKTKQKQAETTQEWERERGRKRERKSIGNHFPSSMNEPANEWTVQFVNRYVSNSTVYRWRTASSSRITSEWGRGGGLIHPTQSFNLINQIRRIKRKPANRDKQSKTTRRTEREKNLAESPVMANYRYKTKRQSIRSKRNGGDWLIIGDSASGSAQKIQPISDSVPES